MFDADALCSSHPETEREHLCREVGLTLLALFRNDAATKVDEALGIRGAIQDIDDIGFWEEVKTYLERFQPMAPPAAFNGDVSPETPRQTTHDGQVP